MKTYKYNINSVIDFGKFRGSIIKDMLNDKEKCKWLDWLINEDEGFRIVGLKDYLVEMAKKRPDRNYVKCEDGKMIISKDFLNVLYHGYINDETLKANEKKINELG